MGGMGTDVFPNPSVIAVLDPLVSGLGFRGVCLGGNSVPRDTDCTDARWRGPRTNTDGYRTADMSCPAFIGEIVIPDKRSADPGSMVPLTTMDAGSSPA